MGNINENIRLLRKERNMTMEQLGKALGVPKQTIHKYESGIVKNIPYDVITKLSEVLNVSPSVLMGWENVPNIENVDKHIELIELYDRLTPDKQEAVIKFIKLFLEVQ